jgi:GNAT superfamily N-acetyltransferase
VSRRRAGSPLGPGAGVLDEAHLRAPGDYRAEATLRDGSRVVLRAIRPSDRVEEAAFVARLSDQSRYLRFFGPKRGLTEAEVRYFTEPDVPSHVALVAQRADAPGEPILAVGRYAAMTGAPGRAEVAFAVDDALHHQGIATQLLHHLAAIARANGFTELHAELLSENRAMLEVLEHFEAERHTSRDGGVVHVVLRLEPDAR